MYVYTQFLKQMCYNNININKEVHCTCHLASYVICHTTHFPVGLIVHLVSS